VIEMAACYYYYYLFFSFIPGGIDPWGYKQEAKNKYHWQLLLLLLLLLLRLVGVECVKSPTNQPTDVSSNSCVLMSNDEGADLLPDDTDDGHS